MTTLFLASLIAGLLVGVFAMFHGVERTPPGASDLVAPAAPSDRSARLNVPVVAAFLLFFGAVGYQLHRVAAGPAWEFGGALAAGVVGASLAVLVVARWALPSARGDVVDERYLLQGHLAQVTVPIPAGGEGEVRYEIENRVFVTRAAGLDGAAIGAGAEVAIERVEGGVTWVESWSRVEQRL